MLAAMKPISDDRLDRVPVFPLPDVYLFPGTLLPLHIFEPRYVQMLQHCMQGDRVLAIASLADAHAAPPTLQSTIGLGQIVAARESEQQTWNIIVRGVERVAVRAEHPQRHLFREIAVRRLPDSPSQSSDPRYPRLRMLLAQVASRAEATRKAIDLMLDQASDADALVHLISAHLIADKSVRQRLLTCIDGGIRLEIACAHMARLLLDIGTRAETTTLH